MFYQLEHIGITEYFKKEDGKNFNYPMHLHQSFELIFLDEGEMTVTISNTAYKLNANEALLIFPNQLHSIQSSVSKHTLFIFSPTIVQSFFSEKNGKLPQNNRFTLSEQDVRLMKGLSQHSSKFMIKGILYVLCDLFDKQTSYYDSIANKDDLLFKVFLYIEQHFTGTCSVQDIAKGTSYNAEYISRVFKKQIGIPCKYYINARRLSHAAYLLAKTEETCLFCALESGFTSLRSFNRNFKKHLNVSPMEYRAKMRNNV